MSSTLSLTTSAQAQAQGPSGLGKRKASDMPTAPTKLAGHSGKKKVRRGGGRQPLHWVRKLAGQSPEASGVIAAQFTPDDVKRAADGDGLPDVCMMSSADKTAHLERLLHTAIRCARAHTVPKPSSKTEKKGKTQTVVEFPYRRASYISARISSAVQSLLKRGGASKHASFEIEEGKILVSETHVSYVGGRTQSSLNMREAVVFNHDGGVWSVTPFGREIARFAPDTFVVMTIKIHETGALLKLEGTLTPTFGPVGKVLYASCTKKATSEEEEEEHEGEESSSGDSGDVSSPDAASDSEKEEEEEEESSVSSAEEEDGEEEEEEKPQDSDKEEEEEEEKPQDSDKEEEEEEE